MFRGRVWQPPQEPLFANAEAFLRDGGKAARWREGLPLSHRSTIFPDVYDRLAKERADVLITHEAPSCHPYGFEAIDLLAASLGVSAVFHSHHHDSLEYSAATATLGFAVYGVGLRGITDLSGRVIVAGERDAERAGRRWPP